MFKESCKGAACRCPIAAARILLSPPLALDYSLQGRRLTPPLAPQRYFGTAVGKGRQAAKTEIERLKLAEMTCQQGVIEVAKM